MGFTPHNHERIVLNDTILFESPILKKKLDNDTFFDAIMTPNYFKMNGLESGFFLDF